MMVGVASEVEMRAHHIQIWPPSCRSTPLERPDMCTYWELQFNKFATVSFMVSVTTYLYIDRFRQ